MVSRIDFEEEKNINFSTFAIHTIILMLEGKICFTTLDQHTLVVNKGEIAFIPIGSMSQVDIKTQSKIILIRLSALPDWNLYCPIPKSKSHFVDKIEGMEKTPEKIKIKPQLKVYVESLNSCLTVGEGDPKLMELKVKELLILTKLIYTDKEVCRLFSAISGRELSFVEYIEQHWNQFDNLQELADSMHLTMRQFTTRFHALFDKTPYQWIIEHRSRCIYCDLIYTRKSLRQISTEHKFKSVPHFNTFCKAYLGKTPGEIRKNSLAEQKTTKSPTKKRRTQIATTNK